MQSKNKKLYKYKFSIMGCPSYLFLYCEDKKQFVRVKAEVLSELRRLDRYYTNYSDTSYTAQINQTAGTDQSITVDYETATLLDYAQECYKHSDGLFDITAGTLRHIWNYHDRDAKLPTQEEIDWLMPAVGWDKVEWNNPELRLPIAGMVLDFGGVVKEYAADAAASICMKHGINNGFINLGGDMRILGPHLDGKSWCMGIINPHDTTKDISYVYLQSGAMVTSGNYERRILIDGKKYGHILNPKTGWPVQGLASVTVLGDFCLVAGSAATIASLMPEEKAIEWLNDLGLPFIGVSEDGKIFQNAVNLKAA